MWHNADRFFSVGRGEAARETLAMANTETRRAKETLERAFAIFQKEHPAVVEAMKAMNLSLHDYLQALARLRGDSSSSGNASSS